MRTLQLKSAKKICSWVIPKLRGGVGTTVEWIAIGTGRRLLAPRHFPLSFP